MVFTNFQPFPFQIAPLTNATPFSYRDGSTFLQQLEQMRVYLNESLVPEFNAAIDNAVEQYNAGLGNAENYVDAAVQFINNKTGQAATERVTLTGPYTLEINPLWPNNMPIDVVLTQDGTGGRVVTLGANITGTLDVNSLPSGRTEFTLVPQGDGTWKVFQFDSVIDGLLSIIDGAQNDINALETAQINTDTLMDGHTSTLTAHGDSIGANASAIAGNTTAIAGLVADRMKVTAPNGTVYRVGITNSGVLTATPI